ncbi:GIY-YIG nuclease family protein [Govanella unica]|uniref:GIY-YIG nuclease family protein n=1 Tax=Govanella unica TaxID=2975056 RepID=A0A9X3TZ51_9PROT|nr:GIY-YIG nuclease family protein [Govania unica]MDA5194646.1 GIY-YIG nuclease family protein [Govania unica]
MRHGFVYILASRRNGTLYVGVTSDLVRRVAEHRLGQIAGFTKDYGVRTLVYYEAFDAIDAAILREKQLKKWARNWKLDLIEVGNPDWRDLYAEIVGADVE